jgi:DNA-binding response OmpR family regulator
MADADQVHVLITDDNAQLRKLLRRALEREGFVVTEAESGTDLLAQLSSHRPDLVVLDIGLPDRDGRDLLSKLKKDPSTAGIPVVVWSGRDPDSDRLIALELGAEDFVEKGPPSELVAKIERILYRVSGRFRAKSERPPNA